jgi:hypothetical protein
MDDLDCHVMFRRLTLLLRPKILMMKSARVAHLPLGLA